MEAVVAESRMAVIIIEESFEIFGNGGEFFFLQSSGKFLAANKKTPFFPKIIVGWDTDANSGWKMILYYRRRRRPQWRRRETIGRLIIKKSLCQF